MRGALTAGLVSLFGATLVACLESGTPCCEFDADCEPGTACFEGRCAPRCRDDVEQADLQCDEGERCVPEAGVCRAIDPEAELEACAYRDAER